MLNKNVFYVILYELVESTVFFLLEWNMNTCHNPHQIKSSKKHKWFKFILNTVKKVENIFLVYAIFDNS